MFSIFKTFSLLTYIFPTVWTHSHAWFIVMARVLGRDCYAELFQSYFTEVSGWNRAAVWLCFSLLNPTSRSKKKKRNTEMPEPGISYLKSALGERATASQALTLQTSGRSAPSAAFVPSDEITPCVMKCGGQRARKNGYPAVINLWIKVKLTLWLKERSLSRGGLALEHVCSDHHRFGFCFPTPPPLP